MVLVRQSVHVASLSPTTQKRVVHVRDKKRLPFWQIALKVQNLKIENPSTQHVLNFYTSFGQSAAAKCKRQ